MRKKILIVILTLNVFVAILTFIFDYVNNKDISKSLAAMFYDKSSHDMERYFKSVNEKIDMGSFDITINEYYIDFYTGIGMVKCTFTIEDYDEERNRMYVEPEYLLSDRNETITDEDNVYCYYRFILNEEGLNQKNCIIYFDSACKTYFYELSFDYDMEHKVFCEENGDKVVISTSGAVEEMIKGNGKKESRMIEESAGSGMVSDMIIMEIDEKIYVVYIFSEFMDVGRISNISEFYEIIKWGNGTRCFNKNNNLIMLGGIRNEKE